MHVDLTHRDGGVTLMLAGEVDADNCARIGAAVLDDGKYEGEADLALDLSELTFIDSSGLTELLAVRQAVSDAGYRLSVAGLVPSVRRTIEISGLADTFGIA